MKIAQRQIDKGPIFVIAELSGNHNGSLELALRSVEAAKRAGADAIKLQTYTADTITLDVKADDFKISTGSAWDGRYLYGLYQQAHTPWEWHPEIFAAAAKAGLICFSSPFDHSAVDFLESLKCPAYKIASPEITDIPLIRYVASKGKPVILSSGIATEEDLLLAIATCHEVNNRDIAILKCTSAYPTPPEAANLAGITKIKDYNVIPGLSDHSMGIEAPVVAVGLGARIIEKHFIIDRALGGVDSHFSLDECEFAEMVASIRKAELMVGTSEFLLDDLKAVNRRYARSLYVSSDVQAGEPFTPANIRSVRPGLGMHPKHYEKVISSGRAAKALRKGTALSEDAVAFYNNSRIKE